MSPFINPLLGGLKPGLVCQVRTLRGEVLVRTPNMVFAQPEAELVGFSDNIVDGEHWRTYTVQRHQLLITIGDRLDEREHLQHAIFLAAALPVALALLGSLVLIWFGIGQGLSPLNRLRLQLASRKADDLAPIAEKDVPVELRPLVETLNQLLERLNALLERERRFNDDAAHELRTPLTAIKTHLQVASMAGEPAQVANSMARAEVAVERMQAMLEQLLLLSRLDVDVEHGCQGTLEPLQIVRQVLEHLFAHPGFSRIEVQSRLEESCFACVPDRLLAMTIRNLLENALKYAPSGVVQLVLEKEQNKLYVRVTDTGDGLSEKDFASAQKRFWRARASHEGSGLGLSIVSAVCQRYQGKLESRQHAGGFTVSLSFPCKNEA
jgi:signal transduction histidine kinase